MALRLLGSRINPTRTQFNTFLSLRAFSARKFTKEHEWVTVENGVGTIGISDHAQSALGDIVFVELPAIGAKFEQNATIGFAESVKAASDIYAPVGGEVVEKNTALEGQPSLVNSSPYDKGWLVKVKLSNPSQLDALLTEDHYKKFLAEHK
jgi:glycine cleavage system H protein